MRDDQRWIVSWEIDAHQPTPHRAAQWARATMLPDDTTATVFTVTDSGTGERWSVDLEDNSLQSLPPLVPDIGRVLVTRTEAKATCRRCGYDAMFTVNGDGVCAEHLVYVIGDILPQPQTVTVAHYSGQGLCVVANGHDNTRAEYRAGKWLVCYRHLGRGVAASVRGYGRP